MHRRVNVAETALAGGLFLVALYFGWSAFDYDMGTLRSPGPGAAPLASASLLGILTILILIEEFHSPWQDTGNDLRGLLLSIAGIAAWAVLARPTGLLPATFVTMLLVSLAERPWRPVRSLFTYMVLSTACYFLFIKLLSAPIALIGTY
jgi:hypothetical protein